LSKSQCQPLGLVIYIKVYVAGTHTHVYIYIYYKNKNNNNKNNNDKNNIYTYISIYSNLLGILWAFPALVTPCSSILAYLRVPGSPSHVSCHDFLISWQWRWLSNNVTMSNRICKHYV
jgi:hypothetical protein